MPRTPLATLSPRAALFAAAAAALLAGCSVSSDGEGTIGQRLGITAGAPDAFLIIAREPLQTPPDFSLPTPQPGATSPRAPDPYAQARESLFGSPVEPTRLAATSGGEAALLAGAGANVDNSAVRAALDDETVPAGERKYGLTSFAGIAIPANLADRDSALESREENRRLRTEGLPTPTAPPLREETPPDFGDDE